MCTSNLPKMLRFFSSCLLFASVVITGCSSADKGSPAEENSPPPRTKFIVDINSASAADLESLPHVGPSLSRKIIEHRERYGPFRRPEHLLVIEGMSEDKFRELRRFINTE